MAIKRNSFVVAALAAFTALAGCTTAQTGDEPAAQGKSTGTGTNAPAPGARAPSGEWEASVQLPGGDISFRMAFARDSGTLTAHILNSVERVPVRKVTEDGHRFSFQMLAFNSRIDAVLEGGVLVGTLTLVKRGGKKQVMPFRAVRAEGLQHRISPVPGPDMTGRWDVTFREDDGASTKAIGEFVQKEQTVTGTFLTPTGDYRYLKGTISGGQFALSCFDGAHAFLFKGKLDDTGVINGDFWSGTQWHESWTAVRDETITLPDPESLTYLREGFDSFHFGFASTSGTLVSSTDERFVGKVVVVTLAGSWCPNCHDEAAFLSDLYNAHQDRGLEAVGLMFEHYRDFATASLQIERFREKHRIQYPLLVAGYSDKGEAGRALPMLNHVMSFPTMIILDRKGDVRRIHTGFSGPGTGEHYEAFKREFTEFIETLLAEGQ